MNVAEFDNIYSPYDRLTRASGGADMAETVGLVIKRWLIEQNRVLNLDAKMLGLGAGGQIRN